ncbi:hypothetical protein HDU89_000269 [Geranomyces variabilis]|nr:hypothetical protein HDU89_000269 [Geranomyces variabilis]
MKPAFKERVASWKSQHKFPAVKSKRTPSSPYSTSSPHIQRSAQLLVSPSSLEEFPSLERFTSAPSLSRPQTPPPPFFPAQPNVPSHIPLLILAYLPLETLALCFAVSRAWAREALSPELWQRHCEDDGVEVGPGAEHLLERCENDPRGWWREVYRDAVVTRKNWRTANFKIVSAPVVDIRDSINCFWFDTDKLIIGTRRHRLSLFHVPSPAHWTQLSTAATAPPPDICFENAHAVAIMAVAVSPQHVLASVDGAGTLALWNVFTGALIAKLAAAHEGGIAGVAFVDGGKNVVTAGFDKVLRVHELRAGASATAESSNDGPTRESSSLPNDQAGLRHSLAAGDPSALPRHPPAMRRRASSASAAAMGSARTRPTTAPSTLSRPSSATTSSSSTTQRRKSRRGGQPSARDTSAPPTMRASSSLSSSSTSSSLPSSPRISQRFRATLARLRRPPLAGESAAGGDAGGASVLSSAAGDSGASPIAAPEPLSLVCTKALRGHAGDIYCLAVTPSDENVVVTGAMDHTVKVWDLAAGASTRSMRGHTDSITALCVRGDNVFSGSLDKTVRHWDIATGRCTRTLRGHTKWVKTLAVNARCLLSGGWDEAVFVWDWREGTLLHSLPVGHGPIVCLRFEDEARGVRAVCRGEGWQHHVCVLDFASQPVSALSAVTTDGSQEAEDGDGCGSSDSDCEKPSAEAT